MAANQTVLIGFHAPPRMLRLRMTLYCVTECFPAEEIEVTLNGTRLTHRVARIEGNWVSLETEAFRPNEKLNVLTLHCWSGRRTHRKSSRCYDSY